MMGPVAGCLNQSFFIPSKCLVEAIGDHGVVGFKWMAAQCLAQMTDIRSRKPETASAVSTRGSTGMGNGNDRALSVYSCLYPP